MRKNSNITQFQLFFLLLHSQVGVSIISLPYEIFKIAKSDSWISILIAGVFIQVMILIFALIMKRFPSNNFFEVIQIVLGKWIGKIVLLILILYFISLGGVILSQFSVIISAWLMPMTPKWILVALIMATALYIAVENLQIISRFLFLTTLTFPIYIAFTIYALKDTNIKYILPVGNSGLSSILEGAIHTLWSAHGFEILLFIYPFVQSDIRGIVKTATYLNICVTLLYTFITFSCLVILSPNELKLVPEPVLYILKSFSFKVIERPDLIITSLWVVIVVTTFVVIIYASSLGLSILLNVNRTKFIVFLTTVTIFTLSLSITGVYEVTAISKYLSPISFFFIYIIPIIILLLSFIFNKKGCDLPS